jgi:hypothetical protein
MEASTQRVTLNGKPSSSKPLTIVEYQLVHIADWAGFGIAECDVDGEIKKRYTVKVISRSRR